MPSSTSVRALCGLSLAGLTLTSGCSQRAVIAVNSAERHQRIVGWEATTEAGDLDTTQFLRFRDELLDRLVAELGVTRLRLEVRSGAERPDDAFGAWAAGRLDPAGWRAVRYATVDDNGDPARLNRDGFHFSELDRDVELIVQPVRERLARAGRTLFVNLCYVAFTDQIGEGGEYGHADVREYGEFIEAAWRHLHEKYGWVPDSLEIILEPDNVPEWDGTKIGHAIVEVARRLKAGGFAVPRFVAPSTSSMTRSLWYFDEMMRVEGAAELLSEYSYHRYSGVSSTALRAIRRRAERYQVDTSMLEFIGARSPMLHEDLEAAGAVAWSQYVIASLNVDSGESYYVVDATKPGRIEIRAAARTPLLRQYFSYIRPGATRIGASTSAGRVRPLAFENVEGDVVVVLACAGQGELSIDGLPAGTYGLSYAIPGGDQHVLPDVAISGGARLSTAMPEAGVMTVFRRKERR